MSHKLIHPVLAVVCMVASLAVTARAAGFAMYETSARGNAMGGAIVGLTDDASAVYNNPANMVDLPGVQTMAGITIIQPTSKQDFSAAGLGGYRLDDSVFAPPHAYATWQLDDSWWFGFGEFSRFGLGTRYDKDWPGRFTSIEAKIQTFSLNPNVAYKINDEFSVAAGVEIMYMDILLEKSMLPIAMGPMILPSVPLTMKGDSGGVGGDLAFSWKPTKDLGVGLVYRLPVRQKIDGHACTDGLTYGPIDIPEQSRDAQGSLVLPASCTLGVNYKATERLNLGVATTYTEWNSYDQLAIAFNPPLSVNGNEVPESTVEKNWHDVFRFGFGAEYQLTESWAVQGGYVYDMDPISYAHADYILPPGNRHIIGTGLGYTANTWTFNVGYSLLLMDTVSFGPRPAEGVLPTKSEYSLAHMFGMSVGKKF